MEAKFYIEADQPKVMIDGEWNALYLFLETDSSFDEARNHIELKKKRQWMGNTSVLQLVSGSLFEVSTELDLDLSKVEIFQKKLLVLIDAWDKFEKERVNFPRFNGHIILTKENVSHAKIQQTSSYLEIFRRL